MSRVIEFRHKLHSLAELSFEEHRTQEYILSELISAGIECRKVAGTGILAVLHGTNPSPTTPVVLRADIDALPICEATELPYRAINNGVMHACGHDMHAAVLMSVLLTLNTTGGFEGTIWGIFQPGEECAPGGASIVIKEGVFDGVDPIAVIGAHVAPQMPVGVFGFRSGLYMASADEIHLTITGSGGHAAQPRTGGDTVVAMAKTIVALQQIVTANDHPTVLSFGKVDAAGASNVIPQIVTVAGTLRTLDEKWREEAKTRIIKITSEVACECGVKIEVQYASGYPSVVNDDHLTTLARELAVEMFDKDHVVALEKRMTAEDFGFYSQRFHSLFYRFGVGEQSGLSHTSTFNPNEQALEHAVEFMLKLALLTKKSI